MFQKILENYNKNNVRRRGRSSYGVEPTFVGKLCSSSSVTLNSFLSGHFNDEMVLCVRKRYSFSLKFSIPFNTYLFKEFRISWRFK